jgi:beta-galactosidase GanA
VGELANSSASDLEYMGPMWAKLLQMNLNTVVAPVYWELIEPAEGIFDFELVDGLIQKARKNNLKLVLLWF